MPSKNTGREPAAFTAAPRACGLAWSETPTVSSQVRFWPAGRQHGLLHIKLRGIFRRQTNCLLTERSQNVPIAFQRYPHQLAPSAHFGFRKKLLDRVLDYALGDV